MGLRRVITCVAVVVVAAGASVAMAAQVRGPDPRLMVLRSSDLVGYVRVSGAYSSNADKADGLSPALARLVRENRLGGYDVTFRTRLKPDTVTSVAGAGVGHYRTPVTAAQLLHARWNEIEQIGTAERIPLRQSIGDEARLYKASIDVYLKDKGVGYTHEEYDVEYRYGPVVGGVNLNGPRGDVTAAMVLLLARKQLARIKLELG